MNIQNLKIVYVKANSNTIYDYINELNSLAQKVFNHSLYPNYYCKYIVIIMDNDNIIASGCIMGTCAIYNICIDEEYRGNNISYLLINSILKLIKDNSNVKYAYTNSTNPIAQYIFKKIGFEELINFMNDTDKKHYRFDLSKI